MCVFVGVHACVHICAHTHILKDVCPKRGLVVKTSFYTILNILINPIIFFLFQTQKKYLSKDKMVGVG